MKQNCENNDIGDRGHPSADQQHTEQELEPKASAEIPTPLTDSAAFVMSRVPVQVGQNGVCFMDAEVAPAWLCRKLERELAEMKLDTEPSPNRSAAE